MVHFSFSFLLALFLASTNSAKVVTSRKRVVVANNNFGVTQKWQPTGEDRWTVYDKPSASFCTVLGAEKFVVDIKCNGTKFSFPLKPQTTLQRGVCTANMTRLMIRSKDHPLDVGFAFKRWDPPSNSPDHRKYGSKIFYLLDSVMVEVNSAQSAKKNRTYCKISAKLTNLTSFHMMKAPVGTVHHCEDSNTRIELNKNVAINLYSLEIQTFRDSSKGNSSEFDDPGFDCQAMVTRREGFVIFLLIFIPASTGGVYYLFTHCNKRRPSERPASAANKNNRK